MPLRAKRDLTKSLLSRGSIKARTSVFALVDKPVFLDPRHHVPELCSHGLDLLLGSYPAHRLERRRAGPVLEYEFARELAGLNLLQYPLHLRFGLVGHDPRSAREVAVFRGVRHGVAHVRDA